MDQPGCSFRKNRRPQSFNHYIYAANDPVNLVDPLGLDPAFSIGAFFAGTIVAQPGMVGTLGFDGEVGMVITPTKPEIPEPQEPPKPSHERPRNDCTNMADSAQQIANRVIGSADAWKGKGPAATLQRFNRIFATAFAGTYAAEGVLGMLDMPMWGSSQQTRADFGKRGFPQQFRDEKYPQDEATKHSTLRPISVPALQGIIYLQISIERLTAREMQTWADKPNY